MRLAGEAGHARMQAEALFGACSSVFFGRGTRAGAVLLGIVLCTPAAGLGALAAVLASNASAAVLGYRSDSLRSGHYGYAGLLVGLATMQGRDLNGNSLVLVVQAGIAATFLTAVLGDALTRNYGLPALALPFVLLASLLGPALGALPRAADPWIAAPTSLLPHWQLQGFPGELLEAFAAVFFQYGPLPGLLIAATVVAISRITAACYAIGAGVALLLAHPLFHVGDPALRLSCAYNAGLTCAALGSVLFVPGRAALLAGLLGALLSMWVSATLAGPCAVLGMPLTAWPFALVAPLCARALMLRAPDRPPYVSEWAGLSPERNLELATTLARRFRVPGPPRFAAPIAGAWTVSQGFEGEHTHQGAWAQALDLEIRDERGFPFRSEGTRNEDYACWGAPVSAPASGTVVLVQDFLPDLPPGESDERSPWGNAIVLQHAPECFSVLAHLGQGSATVRAGNSVLEGQRLGACGSSGRSPRPHLHFQVQRSAVLGAPSVPFQLVNYVTTQDANSCFVFSGVPLAGTSVARHERSALVDGFTSALAPGAELVLHERDGTRCVLRSEVNLHGDRSLFDRERNERLYFSSAWGDFACISYQGSRGSPLWALFAALPRLPSCALPLLHWSDTPPEGLFLPRTLALLTDFVRPLAEPASARARCKAVSEGGRLVVETHAELRLLGRRSGAWRARVELDAQGLHELQIQEQTNARSRTLVFSRIPRTPHA